MVHTEELPALTSQLLQSYCALRAYGHPTPIQDWPVNLVLDRLYQLVLIKCTFSRIPDCLRQAKQLRMLQVQAALTELPRWLDATTYPHLVYLDVSSNDLRNLPLTLATMPELMFVIARENTRLTPHLAPHANDADPTALLRYLKLCAKGVMEQQRHIRVMLLGLPMVGKSALLECLKHAGSSTPARLLHDRVRTQCPVIEPVEHRVKHKQLARQGVDTLHCLFTDPPGTPADDMFGLESL